MKQIRYINVGLLIILLAGSIALVAQYTGKQTTTKIGTGALPATCSIGDTAFKTDATAGSNWFGCTSSNIWTQLSGTGATGNAVVTTIGALPLFCTYGSTFNFTDSTYQAICGTSNIYSYFVGTFPVNRPPTSTVGWSWVNQRLNAAVTPNGEWIITEDANNTQQYSAFTTTLAASTYTIEVGLRASRGASTLPGFLGIVIADGQLTTSKYIFFGPSATNDSLFIQYNSQLNTFGSTIFSTVWANEPIGFKIIEDAANRTYYVSTDMVRWTWAFQQAHNATLTASYWGIFTYNSAAAWPPLDATAFHLKVL